MDWQKVFEITEALPAGPYELLVEIIDAEVINLLKKVNIPFLFWRQNEDDKR